jgi:hypothetical protein
MLEGVAVVGGVGARRLRSLDAEEIAQLSGERLKIGALGTARC